MEFLDIVDRHGNPTGQTVERTVAHREGIPHRTSHVWILRRRGDRTQILLQKRCESKDSFPGCYDISSAGHIPAGVGFRASAIRELYEELGVAAREDDLIDCGGRVAAWDGEFHGSPFHDREYAEVFALWCDKEESDFIPQPEEVSAVRWMELEELIRAVRENTIHHCIYPIELEMIKKGIGAL